MGNKIVIVNGETLVDHTKTTVTPSDVKAGKLFYNQVGDIVEGTLPSGLNLEITPSFDDNGVAETTLPGNAIYDKVIITKPSNYIKVPTNELNIKANGEYDVTNYGSVDVKVPEPKLQCKVADKNRILVKPDADYDALKEVYVDLGDFQEKVITENGEYKPDIGYSAFSKVVVNTQEINLQDSTTITPSAEKQVVKPTFGYDGFKEVTVNPYIVKTEQQTVVHNGVVVPSTSDSYLSQVIVNVQPSLSDITLDRNGRYFPPSDLDGYNNILVAVPDPKLEEITISPSEDLQQLMPSSDAYGLSKVTINPIKTETLDVDTNGQYRASDPNAYLKEVNVNVQPRLEGIEITENGTYLACPHIDGYDKIFVSVTPDAILLQDKEIVPNSETQVVYTDVGYDALKSVTVLPVPTTTLEVLDNGDYEAPEGLYYDKVNVNIHYDLQAEKDVSVDPFKDKSPVEVLPDEGFNYIEKINVNFDVSDRLDILVVNQIEDAIYVPKNDEDKYAFSQVRVEIPVDESLTIVDNGTYSPSEGKEAIKQVNVQIPLQEKLSVVHNGLFTPDEGYKAISSVEVAIPEIELVEVTPTEQSQTIDYEEDTVVKKILVNPIPDEYLIPTGKITITENTTDPNGFDISAFERVVVNVDVSGNGVPIEVASSDEMDTLLDLANPEHIVVYRYTGPTTETYEQGALYLVEAVIE